MKINSKLQIIASFVGATFKVVILLPLASSWSISFLTEECFGVLMAFLLSRIPAEASLRPLVPIICQVLQREEGISSNRCIRLRVLPPGAVW